MKEAFATDLHLRTLHDSRRNLPSGKLGNSTYLHKRTQLLPSVAQRPCGNSLLELALACMLCKTGGDASDVGKCEALIQTNVGQLRLKVLDLIVP